MEKFTIGLILGGIAGAVLTANNYKMRALVKKSQEDVKQKLDEIMDDKLEDMEKAKEKAEEKFDEVKEKVEDKKDEIKEKIAPKRGTRKPVTETN